MFDSDRPTTVIPHDESEETVPLVTDPGRTPREVYQERLDRLINALTDGSYTQGFDRLRDGDRFCCLGVASDLVDGQLGEWIVDGIWIAPDGTAHTAALAAEVRDYYGFVVEDGTWEDELTLTAVSSDDTTKTVVSLVDTNDKRASFETIANILRDPPEGMFTWR